MVAFFLSFKFFLRQWNFFHLSAHHRYIPITVPISVKSVKNCRINWKLKNEVIINEVIIGYYSCLLFFVIFWEKPTLLIRFILLAGLANQTSNMGFTQISRINIGGSKWKGSIKAFYSRISWLLLGNIVKWFLWI